MALRLSDGFLAALAGGQGYYDILKDCTFNIYSGTQPTTANAAPTGTLLATVTNSSGVYTAETRAIALLDFTGTTGTETLTALTIGGVEVLNSTVTFGGAISTVPLFAAAVADAINAKRSVPDYNAVASANTVTIYAAKNAGTTYNNAAVVATGTCVDSHLTSGGEAAAASPHTFVGNGRFGSGAGGNTAGVAASNGLSFTFPADTTILSKSGTWSGLAIATGTAGWGRFICRNRKTGAADSGSLDASLLDTRMDVAVGTSAATAEAVVASLSISANASQTVNSFALTIGG